MPTNLKILYITTLYDKVRALSAECGALKQAQLSSSYFCQLERRNHNKVQIKNSSTSEGY